MASNQELDMLFQSADESSYNYNIELLSVFLKANDAKSMSKISSFLVELLNERLHDNAQIREAWKNTIDDARNELE